MDSRGYACSTMGWRTLELTELRIALAEHYATSKSPLARGLKIINTEKATVPMR